MLRFENEAEDLLHYLKDTGLHPGLEGKLDQSGEEEIVIDVERHDPLDHAQRRGDRVGRGRPLAAAARQRSPTNWYWARSATGAS